MRAGGDVASRDRDVHTLHAHNRELMQRERMQRENRVLSLKCQKSRIEYEARPINGIFFLDSCVSEIAFGPFLSFDALEPLARS